jgi:hypothetical protein
VCTRTYSEDAALKVIRHLQLVCRSGCACKNLVRAAVRNGQSVAAGIKCLREQQEEVNVAR